MTYIVMGVCGCGKTSVGKGLAARLDLPFYDADDFHPPTNKVLMSAGVPLTDENRRPWLLSLYQQIKNWNQEGGAVLACSALKKGYRDLLREGENGAHLAVRFIYLQISLAQVSQRLGQRQGHFFPKELLASQFSILEEPTTALKVEVNDLDNQSIITEILAMILS